MKKLIILSEVNCISYLRKHGVFPSEFYTDINAFENSLPYFNNVNVVCIVSGNCLFSRSKLESVLNYLSNACKDAETNSISNFYVLSNVEVGSRPYYKYTKNLSEFVYIEGKRVYSVDNFWKSLDIVPSNTRTFLCNRDNNVVIDSVNRYNEYLKTHVTELSKLIKKPDREMFE